MNAGEVLYIPSMWYHYVTQTCLTIAVNYWYDQRFDFRYVFYQTIRNIYCNTNINKNVNNNENCDDKDAKLNTALTCGVLNTNINNNPNKSSSNNIN